MSEEILKDFSITKIEVLNESGDVDSSMMEGITDDIAKEMYYQMKFLRVFDQKLFNLQRTGKIGSYAQTYGQEACQAGTGLAMEKNDWFAPSFRELGVYLAKGADRVKCVQIWNGDTRANVGLRDIRALPVSIPISSQTLHACGIAMASKLKGEKDVCTTFFGEGGSSEGDFHEAANFAGVYELPMIFFCQRNGWSISTPYSEQTKTPTIAQKSIAHGITGVIVDGNDVFAVYKVMKEALARAREGKGATLIEADTYRLGDHTTSDDATKYRDPAEVEMWKKKDPIIRLEKYLRNKGAIDDGYVSELDSRIDSEIADAVEKGLSVSPVDVNMMFEDIYVKKPKIYEEQEAEIREELSLGGME